MKPYKIDLSGFTGKVREVVITGILAHAGKIGYNDKGTYTDALLNTDCLVIWEDGDITWGEPADKKRFTPITAADFLALETAKEPEFKPFDKVLVRDDESDSWRLDFFSHKGSGVSYVCVGSVWALCIPYEGNERLIGTTDSPVK